jgi:hypothetical protein
MSPPSTNSNQLNAFPLVIAIACGVFLLSTCLTSRLYWGYWFTPPSSNGTVRHLAELTSFTSFWQHTSQSGRSALSSGASEVNHASGDAPGGRLPAALIARGLLPSSERPVDASILRAITTALAERKLLRHGDPGYPDAAKLLGQVAVGKDRNGNELYVAALIGGEASNDHHPYYELVAEPARGDGLKIRQLRFYWWDLAGLEGMAHWIAGILATVTWLVCAGFFLAIRRAASRLGPTPAHRT